MTNFVFTYHGGSGMPESKEEQDQIMEAWGAWMGGLGAIGQRQVARIEGLHLAAEEGQEASGFLGDETGIGALAQRAVEGENAGRMAGIARRDIGRRVDRLDGVGDEIGQVRKRHVGQAIVHIR